jgi:response regulator RpfG family c-di-GMP phosphodiesterase
MKIFICEPDDYKAKLMHGVLSVYNYKIITLKKGANLLNEVTAHRPSVIIYNEDFSSYSPESALDRLRSNPETADIPIIFIGGEEKDEDKRFRYDNLIEYVHEPIRLKNLRHYVDRYTTLRTLITNK